LEEFFRVNNKVALAFSGGTDSAYLLYEAAKAGADVTAYYVRSQFPPCFEYEDAVEVVGWLEENLGAGEGKRYTFRTPVLKVLDLDILSVEGVKSNGCDRCYHCKKAIMQAIREQASLDGYGMIVDGNNASDVALERPGMRATAELGVRSPLRELGITKSDVRELSGQAGLPTANKPAYACLATRIQSCEEITVDKLATTEAAETILHELGFSDFRIRMHEDRAASGCVGIVQTRAEQAALLQKNKSRIITELSELYSRIEFEKR